MLKALKIAAGSGIAIVAAEFLQLSCLQDDCMTRGRGMLNGGYRYLGGTVRFS